VEPTNIRFGGGASHTILHPLVALVLLLAIALIFILQRKYVLVPFLLTVFLTPFGQVLVLGGVHFTVYRILIIFGLARLATTKIPGSGRLPGGFNAIDTAFTLCALFTFLTFSLQWMQTQALIKGLGSLLDALGGYFLLRFFIQDKEDIYRTIKVFAFIALVVGVCMANEQFTHRNVFGLLGGVPVEVVMRDDKPRSTGPFEVYITAGAFGASILPLFVSLWSDAKARITALVGMAAASLMTLTSNSSTPLLAYIAAVVGLCFWPLRKRMRAFRWGLVLLLVGLHLIMKAPVWALIARVDLTGSSSGYQRFLLIDNCIRHFSDWWLIGTKDYQSWGYDMWDLSDQYVASAVTGGLVTIVAFILVISRSFGRLGTARKLVEGDRKQEWFIWCLCAALLAHVVAYFGIGYFDQIQFAWYAFLGMVSAATVITTTSPAKEPVFLNMADDTALSITANTQTSLLGR
jgi:hypothetical protein